MNQVSECCHRAIQKGSKPEFPLGDNVWYKMQIIDICECCGRECEVVESCEVCGVVGCDERCDEVVGA